MIKTNNSLTRHEPHTFKENPMHKLQSTGKPDAKIDDESARKDAVTGKKKLSMSLSMQTPAITPSISPPGHTVRTKRPSSNTEKVWSSEDYNKFDIIDGFLLSDEIANENSKGKPLIIIRFQLKRADGAVVIAHTSSANFYTNHEKFEQASRNHKLEYIDDEVVIAFNNTDQPIHVCKLADIHFNSDDITPEQECVFLFNADARHMGPGIRTDAALGYVAAMLDNGYLFPRDRQAAKNILDNISADRKIAVLSPALEFFAQQGNLSQFSHWISLGAQIRAAIDMGYDPQDPAQILPCWIERLKRL